MKKKCWIYITCIISPVVSPPMVVGNIKSPLMPNRDDVFVSCSALIQMDTSQTPSGVRVAKHKISKHGGLRNVSSKTAFWGSSPNALPLFPSVFRYVSFEVVLFRLHFLSSPGHMLFHELLQGGPLRVTRHEGQGTSAAAVNGHLKATLWVSAAGCVPFLQEVEWSPKEITNQTTNSPITSW